MILFIVINFFYSYFLIGYYALGNSGRAIVDLSIVISQIGTCNSVIFCFIENNNPFMFLPHCVIHGQLSICNAHNFSKTVNLRYTRAFSPHFARNKFKLFFSILSEVVVFFWSNQKFYDCSVCIVSLNKKVYITLFLLTHWAYKCVLVNMSTYYN